MVLSDTIENTSDHLPIQVTIRCSGLARLSMDNTGKCRPDWDKLQHKDSANVYSGCLAGKLHLVGAKHFGDFRPNDSCIIENHCIDSFVHDITSAVLEASDETVPTKVFRECLKPYWTNKLSELARSKKQTLKEWREAGEPRGKENVIWQKYKTCKKDFRRAQRKALSDYELKI